MEVTALEKLLAERESAHNEGKIHLSGYRELKLERICRELKQALELVKINQKNAETKMCWNFANNALERAEQIAGE